MISHPDPKEIGIEKCTQIGLTEIALADCMKSAKEGQSTVYFMPVAEQAKDIDERARHWIRTVPSVNAEFLPGDADKKTAGNTNRKKYYKMATQYFFGGASSSTTSSYSATKAYLDEYARSKKDIDNEGGILGAARGRFAASETGGQIYIFSTPVLEDDPIAEFIRDCGDNVFECEIPCPVCDEYSTLHWGEKDDEFGIKWDEDDDMDVASRTVRHVCRHCSESWTQDQYQDVVDRCRWVSASGLWFDHSEDGDFKREIDGEWQIVKPPSVFGIRHCKDGKGLYGVGPWHDAVRVCIQSTKAERTNGNTSQIQRFENEFRGIYFKREAATVIDVNEFLERREHYENPDDQYDHPIPAAVQYLTFGADFGSADGGYVSYQIDGHGANGERWAIRREKVSGDCEDPESRMYTVPDAIMSGNHERVDGKQLPISLSILDVRHNGDLVKQLAAKDSARRICVQGGSNERAPIYVYDQKKCWTTVTPPETFKGKPGTYGCFVITINPHTCSSQTYHKLGLPKDDPAYYHFPIHEDFGRAFGNELTADKPVKRWKKQLNDHVLAYEKANDSTPNEGHDTTKYNTLALVIGEEFGIIVIDNDYKPGEIKRLEIPHPVQTQKPALDIAKGYDAFGNMFR